MLSFFFLKMQKQKSNFLKIFLSDKKNLLRPLLYLLPPEKIKILFEHEQVILRFMFFPKFCFLHLDDEAMKRQSSECLWLPQT